MIQKETRLIVADNTGAKLVGCFGILGATRARYARVGDVIRVSVKEADPKGSVKKGETALAVVVRTNGTIKRTDGTTVKFYDDACVIIDDKQNPKGTRIFGSVAREVKDKGFIKICSLAPEVI